MSPDEIAVAVCARAEAPFLASCLDALRATGAEPLVFRAAAGRGLAEARNTALDAVGDSAVLALVEDDVVVSEGWLAALQRGWASAEGDCACIGGPLVPEFISAPPTWLTGAQFSVLGVPADGTTFHGANVSFRADALRGIGGFWPARGRPELRDWFSEEHFAQQELADAGWTAHREPRLRARRLIDPARLKPGDVLARRARYGARSALVGHPRPRRVAAKAVASGTGGTAIAALRRDLPTTMERAARAIENVGVLVGRPLADPALAPVNSATPFRHSIPAPSARRWWPVVRVPGSRPLILVYHRVGDAAGAGSVGLESFVAQIELLRRRRTLATINAIVDGSAPRDAVAVTFDDGYVVTMRNVLPVLEQAQVPATVFIPTGYVAGQHAFWWDELERLLAMRAGQLLRLTVEGETRSWADAARAMRHVVSWLQPMSPEAIAATMVELRTMTGQPSSVPETERPLSIAELRTLAASPMISIGAHTRTHPNLRFATPERRRDELVGSRDDLARWLPAYGPPAGLAYPFGVPGSDVDAATQRAAADAGFRYAVLNQAGVLSPRTSRFALPRSAPPDSAGAEFVALIH